MTVAKIESFKKYTSHGTTALLSIVLTVFGYLLYNNSLSVFNGRIKLAEVLPPGENVSNRNCGRLAYSHIGGFYGNKLFQFAALVSLAQNSSREPVYDARYAYQFELMESTLHVPILDRVNLTENQWSVVPRYKDSELLQLVLANKFELPCDGKLIAIEGYFFHYRFFENIREKIVKMFKFRQHIQQAAEQRLDAVLSKHKVSRFDRTIRLVGVHIRWTRRENCYSKDRLIYYLLDAMHYDKEMMSNKKVYFVALGDTPSWITNFTNAHPVDNFINFYEEFDKGHFYWQDNTLVEDLCILTLCHANIITSGTYSFWAGYLTETPTITLWSRVCQGMFDAYPKYFTIL